MNTQGISNIFFKKFVRKELLSEWHFFRSVGTFNKGTYDTISRRVKINIGRALKLNRSIRYYLLIAVFRFENKFILCLVNLSLFDNHLADVD
jgi:hypothetical protein